MKIRYNQTAIADIQEAERYIAEQLHNKSAARKLTSSIVDAISLLGDNPYMGAALSGKFDVDTDLRYFIVARHLVFYRIGATYIQVTRVIDGRQDYMAILF